MKNFRSITYLSCAAAVVVVAAMAVNAAPPHYINNEVEYFIIDGDTLHLHFIESESVDMYLNEGDIEEFAVELGVEVAAIKAVIDIEAGKTHQGFWSEGYPILNFDLTVFRQMASRHGVNLSKYYSSHPLVFSRPNISKYGSQQAAVQARLDCAMSIDTICAIEGTFWGMFQIGGFNWKLCGMSSAQEFWQKMSRSERDQLELFGYFITNSGLLPALKAKNWTAFARGYNGPGYAAHGYHTRLANAYARYSRRK